MNITAQKPKDAEQILEIELTELEMQKYYDAAVQKISTQINVKGFRPGKIPRDVVEQHVEKEHILATAVDLALPPTFSEAVQKENIEAIGRPQITIISQFPLKYKAVIPIYPEVKVENLSRIKLVKKPVEVADQEVEDEIKRMSKYHATFKEIDRPAENGDRLEIDFTGYDEGGAVLEGTVSKNHPLLLGEKTLIPGFEEQLVGAKKGEEKEIWVTFPADYFHKPFQNKKVRFMVKVHKIEETITPPLQEIIPKVSGQNLTGEEFKAVLKSNIEREKTAAEQDRIENELLENILKNTKVKLPHSLIDEEIHYMVEQQKQQVESRGMKWEEYLQAKNLSQDKFHDEFHPEAEKRLTLRFGIQEVFKELKIEVTDQELNSAWENELKVLSSLNYSPTDLDLENMKTRLKNKLKMEKLVANFTK